MQLCRHIYHCTPSELDAQDHDRVRVHMALLDVEATVQAALSGKPLKRPSRGRAAKQLVGNEAAT